MPTYRTFLLIWIFISLYTTQAQTNKSVKFDRLASENFRLVKGISQNWIYSIMQDRYGYVWFGTWDGLNKYDGYNFTTFNVADGLSDHTVYSLLEDYDGNIWVGTDKGLNIFNRKNKEFHQIEIKSSDSVARYFERINHVIQARDSVIWIATGAGLKKYDPDSHILSSYLASYQEYFSPRSNFILHLYEDDKGKIWASTTFGLVIFDPQTERSTRYYHIPGDSTGLSHDNIRCVIQERSGNFWIGTRHGLNYFDTTTQKIRQFFHDPDDPGSLCGNWIRTIYEDRSGNIWLGTDDGGLCQYDRNTNSFSRFTNKINDSRSISNNRVYSIFEDVDGNLWVGTYNGVNKINKYTNSFKHIKQTQEINRGLSSNFVWDFFEDDNNQLWIATSNGVNIYNRDKEEFSFLSHEKDAPLSLNSNEVRTMIHCPQLNCVWIVLYGTGIDRIDLQTHEIKHFVPSPDRNSLSDEYVSDMLYTDDDYLFIATSRGLNRLDPKSGNFTVFTHMPSNLQSISSDVVTALFVDEGKNLWVGTDNGLNKYRKEEGSFTRYFFGTERDVLANTFFAITEDDNGILWLGTSGNGLIRFNPQTGDYKVYDQTNGLPNNIVYAILQQDDRYLWMSTNMGLVKFDMTNEQFITYDVKDGIQSYEFNLGSAYKGTDGLMYFGGMNGYNVFDPRDIKINSNIPVTVISEFRKFNERQPFELHNGDTIHLAYDDNFFSFEISALDYTNPGNNKYQYYLEGVDKSWTTVDASNRIAEYKKVRPGKYAFYARGSNNDGIWNTEGIAITILIKPPWYATWMFRILLVIALGSTAWIIISRRVKRTRKKHEVEKKMLEIEKQKFELEQKALRLQMNPHFIFNSLNSIQSYILTHDTEMAVNYLGKFSQLMRLILANSGNNYVVFKEELLGICHYLDLEKLRFDNKFDYSLNIDPDIDTEFSEIPPMVIQPYIENAIIHGILHNPLKGKLEIDFKLRGKNLLCTITDNGIGREKAAKLREKDGIKRRSSGMYITKARLEMLNKESNEEFSVRVTDLKDDKGKATGTRVELIIQYNED